jgi:hypothetical protein
MKRLLTFVVPALLLLGACTSPEARRTRGGGSGADVGNRPAHVEMHGGSDQFWKTPDRIRVEHVPLEPARQAREGSPGGGS